MITFRPMQVLAPIAGIVSLAPWRVPRRHALAALLLAVAPMGARAQLQLTHTEDAAPIPAGMLRFRMTTGWSRIDERFTANGVRTLTDEISTDSLGPRQLPRLTVVEQGLKTLANDGGTRLTLGRLNAQSDIRTVTTPIALELGLTRRLSVGVMVPIIQTRRSMHVTVNGDSTRRANVGFIPARTRGSAAGTNAALYAALRSAADSLGQLIANCPKSPNAPGCSSVNADVSGAAAARTQAQAFADAVRAALGIDSTRTLLAPRTGSALATAIETQRAATVSRVQQYLGPGAATSSHVFTADADFSYIDLQGRGSAPGLLQSTLGGGLDSLQTVNRLVIGGATFAARVLVFDNFQYDTLPRHGLHARMAVGGEYRYETTRGDSAKQIGSVSPIIGSGVGVSSALDVTTGRLAATLAARYDKPLARTVDSPLLGNPESYFPVPIFGAVTMTPGAVVTLDVTPRFLLGEWFALDGLYGIERTGAATYVLPGTATCDGCGVTAFAPNTATRTAQRAGFGVRYSTVDSYLRGTTRTPIEVSFTHLETIAGDPGVAKINRDQVAVRIFVGR